MVTFISHDYLVICCGIPAASAHLAKRRRQTIQLVQDMPIIRSQLQRSLGRQFGHHTANFRSCSRPFGAFVAPHSRQLYCLASGEASNNGESGSRGQGFGKPSSSQQKKQKLQVSNTADALLRSLGGKLLTSAYLESVGFVAYQDDGVLRALYV